MSDKDSKKASEHPTDPYQLIQKAGKLNYSIEQTASIVCSYFHEKNKKLLINQLSVPGTKEYDSYQSGKDMQMFEVESALYDSATSGDADAQETLLKLQTDKNISKIIEEKFFPKDLDNESKM